MSAPLNDTSELLPDGMDQELLQELQSQTLDNLRTLRTHQRVEIRTAIRLRPGNSSSNEPDLVGTTADLSEGGSLATFPRPVLVGDVYRIQIEDPQLDVPMVYGRCLRCRLTREDSFEAAFRFFNPISFGEPGSDENDLLS